MMAAFARPTARTAIRGLYLAGGGAHPGAGVPMATLSARHAAEAILHGPNFDLDVPPDGYAWWYVDGISDDGTRAVSVIGFIGSVFSPWYAWSGRSDPANHCCINVATYGRGGRFTMTDRGRSALRQSRDTLTVGPSSMRWDGRSLVIDIDEVSAPPLISRVRGQITVTPSAMTSVELPLTPDGAHVWRPFAPVASIEVDLEAPGWQWNGHGYFDANFGTRALEAGFQLLDLGPLSDAGRRHLFLRRHPARWQPAGGGSAVRPGRHRAGHRRPAADTHVHAALWAVRRETRGDPGHDPASGQDDAGRAVLFTLGGARP